MTPALGEQRGLLGVHHVEERVVERAQVRVDLLGERARQEAERLPRLDRRTRQDDAADLLVLERLDRHRHRQVGLAGAGRTDAERHRVLADGVDVALLPGGLGPDRLALVGQDHVAVQRRGRALALTHELDRALDRWPARGSRRARRAGSSRRRATRPSESRPAWPEMVIWLPRTRDVGLELVLDDAQQRVALAEQSGHVELGRDDESDLCGLHDGLRHSVHDRFAGAEPATSRKRKRTADSSTHPGQARPSTPRPRSAVRRTLTVSPSCERRARNRHAQVVLRRPAADPLGFRRLDEHAGSGAQAPRDVRGSQALSARAELRGARGRHRWRHLAGHGRQRASPAARCSGRRAATLKPMDSQNSRVASASSSVSPGKPHSTSVVTASPGRARRAASIRSAYSAEL